jgi:hypothetical protein
MATLAGNTIASTYPLLLKIDSSGIDGTLRAVEDGDGTDSALSIATDSVLIKGSGVKLYFHDADGGEYISGDGTDLTIAAGTALNITADVIDLSDATKDVTLNAAVDALNFDSNTLSIDASHNRVGIGTAAPSSNLHVENAASAAVMQLKTTATNSNMALRMDNDAQSWDIQIRGGDADAFQIRNASTDSPKLVVLPSGNVGIGTDSPTGLIHADAGTAWNSSGVFPFHFQNLDPNAVDAYGMLVRAGGNDVNTPIFEVQDYAGNVDFSVRGNGKVGIGTTNPGGLPATVSIRQDNNGGVGAVLQLVNDPGGSTSAGTECAVSFNPHHSGEGGEVARISAINENASARTAITFKTHTGSSGTEKMRILSGGGITFNGDTATANALDDYEEGTWTPTIGDFTLNSGTLAFTARYTKIGRVVTVNAVQTGGNITWTAGKFLDGMPFAPASGGTGSFSNTAPSSGGEILLWTTSKVYFAQAGTSQTTLTFNGSYFV